MLLDAILEVGRQPVVLAPGDAAAEWANTCWPEVTAGERSMVSVRQIVSAVESTAEALRQQVLARGGQEPATFYVWHDAQAGQLRCSVTSRPPTDLPFGGRYQLTDDLTAVVAPFMDDMTPGFISWDELEPAVGSAPESSLPALLVWTRDIGVLNRHQRSTLRGGDL